MLAERFDHYTIIQKLGAGGMGEVYEAHDEKLDRVVALKVIGPKVLDSSDARERFLREARAGAKLNHPAIVQIHHLLEWRGRDGIVMELVPGKSLREILRAGPLPLHTALGLGSQIAEGLAAAHAVGLVHRDLKAENVMVTPDHRAKILDFGLVKQPTSQELPLSVPGMVMGTLHAMAPEQAQGKPVDARSDLFSLGVLLYEAITGEAPFLGRDERHTITLLLTHRQAPARRLAPAVPEALSALIDRLLEKNPEMRPDHASEVAGRLREITEELPAEPGPSEALTDVAPATEIAGQHDRPTLRSSELTEVLPGARRPPPLDRVDLAPTAPTRIPLSSAIRVPTVRHLVIGTLALGLALAATVYSTWDRLQAERLYRDGVAAMESLDPADATQEFEKALGLRSDHARAWTELAYAQWLLGRDIEARRSAQSAVDSASSTELPAAEAVLYETLQDFPQALDRYRRLAREDGGSELLLRTARAQLQAGRHDDARETLEELPEASTRDPRRFLIEARLAAAEEKYQRALEAAQKAESAGTGTGWFQARAQLLQASLLQQLEQFDPAREVLEVLGNTLQINPDPRTEGEVLELKALEQQNKGRLDVALRLLDDAVLSHRSIGHQRGEARALGSKGSIFLQQGELGSAEPIHVAALQLAREVGSRKDELAILNALGYLHTVQWNLDQALIHYQEAREVAQALGQEIDEGTLLINMAEIQHRQGHLGAALRLCDEALALHEKAGATKELPYDTLVRGRVLLSRGDLLSARRAIEEALEESERLEQIYENAEARLTMAQLLLAEGNARSAETSALEAEEVLRNAGSPPKAIEAGLLVVEALLRQGRAPAARSALARAGATIRSGGDPYLAIRLDVVTAELQLASGGAPEQALAGLELAIAEARALQAVELSLEAALSASEAERRLGRKEAAGDRLRDVKRQAERMNFLGLARRAEARLTGSS